MHIQYSLHWQLFVDTHPLRGWSSSGTSGQYFVSRVDVPVDWSGRRGRLPYVSLATAEDCQSFSEVHLPLAYLKLGAVRLSTGT